MPAEQFRPFVDRAIATCKSLTFEQKAKGLWSEREILEYGARLPVDEPSNYLTNTLKELIPDTKNRKILVIGDGVGRLGRNIARKFPDDTIIEVDNSTNMVQKALHEANSAGLKKFKGNTGNATHLPYRDDAFDYVLSFGMIRYLNEEDGLKFAQEANRVSKFGVTIADGNVREPLCKIRDSMGMSSSLLANEMSMFRMSLFYMMLNMYKSDRPFRELVDSSALRQNSDFIDVLTETAGTSPGTLYELRLGTTSAIQPPESNKNKVKHPNSLQLKM